MAVLAPAVASTENDAYVELSFSPNVGLISTVRRFVSQFYVQILVDPDITSRLAVASHELLENAVRYSIDGNTSIRVSVKRSPTRNRVAIDTKNRAHPPHIASMRRALDELGAHPDADAYYQTLIRRTAKTTDGSGLGLGRVRAESGMDVTYDITDDIVHVRAEATFDVVSQQEANP